MRLIASLLVRDELARYQPGLTRHLLSYCDEIRILDDGSQDGTGRALYALDGRVRLIRNRHSRWERSGEGAARQQALEWALAAGGDYVLQLDADEVVPQGPALRAFLEARDPVEFPDVVALRMLEVWERPARGPWRIRVDGGWAPVEVPLAWTPPPSSMAAAEAFAQGWEIPQRRLACGRSPEVVALVSAGGAPSSGFDCLHLGWSNPRERQARYERYMEIDGGRYHSLAHLQSILAEPALEPYPRPEGLARFLP